MEMVRKILTTPNPRLLNPSRNPGKVNEAIRKLMDEMVETMQASFGVGLAAVQIGVPLQVFTMKIEEKVYQISNPKIIEGSGERVSEEGCLSIPGWKGETKRFAKVTLKGLDREGKKIQIQAEGLLAQCIQHEMDHLDGILYPSRLTSLETFREVERDLGS